MKIPQYQIHDFVLQSDTGHTNPFWIPVSATFEHESGETLTDET